MTHDIFISYSRRDKDFATRLEKVLEAYVPPKELNLPHRHLDVFRDEEDFTGNEYYQSLDKHLHDSTKLIVLCSPAARSSPYVNDEIRRFARLKGTDHIIALLVSGLPNNEAGPAQADQMAFPDALCEVMTMPLAADYRGFDQQAAKIDRGRYETSWYTTLANIYGISRTEIEQRDKKRRLRRRRITWGTVTGVVAVLVSIAILAWVQRQEAIQQAKVAAAHSLAGKAVKAADLAPSRGLRIRSLLAAESLRKAWTEAGYTAWRTATSQMLRIAADVRTDSVAIALTFTPDAQRLVVLCGERHVHLFSAPGLQQLWEVQAEQTAFELAMSPAGDRVVSYQKGGGAIEILDIEGGAKRIVRLEDDLDIAAFDSMGNLFVVSRVGIWTVDPTTGAVRPRLTFPSRTGSVALSPDAATAVARTAEGLTAFSVGDGSARWRVRHPASDNYDEVLFSGDGCCVIAIGPHQHSILSAATGKVLNSTPVERPSATSRVVVGGDVYVRGTHLHKTFGGVALDLPFTATQGKSFQRLPVVSPSGRYVAGFSQEMPETFSVFDAARGALAFHLTLDDGQVVNGAAFSADGRFLAISSREPSQTGDRLPSKIQVVSLAQDRWVPIRPESRWTFPNKFAVLPADARVVVTDGSDGSMTVYDAGGTRLWQADEKGEGGGDLVVSPSGRFVARLLHGKGWVVTDMASKRSLSIRDGGPLAFAPDEKRVLVSSRIHWLDREAAPQAIPNAKPFNRLWFLSGSNFVIAEQVQDGVADGSVLFDWKTGAVSVVLEGSTFAISPDERRFAALQKDVIGIWTIGAKEPTVRSEPLGFAGFMVGDRDDFLNFNPDGTLLAAAFPNTINIYDANTLRVNFRIPIAQGDRFAGFSLDGKSILTFRWQNGFPEPTLHPITLDGVFLETCAKVASNLTAEEWSRYGPGATPQKTCP
jgi:DNA-binding beta-propeller fold protein YncE